MYFRLEKVHGFSVIKALIFLFLSPPPDCLLRLQLGASCWPNGAGLLCWSHHTNHHMATPHCGDSAQLWTMAAPAKPAAGRHAAVQPEIYIRGETFSLSCDAVFWLFVFDFWMLISWNMVTIGVCHLREFTEPGETNTKWLGNLILKVYWRL